MEHWLGFGFLFSVQLDVEIGLAAKAHSFAPSNRVEGGTFPVHIQAVYRHKKWEITLEANLKAKITLGERYDLLSVEQIPGNGLAAVKGR